MGMYTELLLKARLKCDMPQDALTVLHYLFDKPEETDYYTLQDDYRKIRTKLQKTWFSQEEIKEHFWQPAIDHAFFQCPWWRDIANCCSCYHTPEVFNYLAKSKYIFTRCDLKNYHGEIEQFLEWIKPYLDQQEGDCIGWYWYEEDRSPTLLYM